MPRDFLVIREMSCRPENKNQIKPKVIRTRFRIKKLITGPCTWIALLLKIGAIAKNITTNAANGSQLDIVPPYKIFKKL